MQLKESLTINKNVFSLSRQWFLLALIFQLCVVITFLVTKDNISIMWLDSVGYLFAHEVRSPVYVLFLKLYKMIFGYGSFIPLIAIQISILLASVTLLTRTIYAFLGVSQDTAKICFLILLMPSSVTMLAADQPFVVGAVAMSEALTYPFFLIALSCLITGLYKQKTSSLCWFIFWVAMLALTRRQFLFLYPFCFGMSFFLLIFMRKNFRPFVLLLCTVLSLFCVEMLERSYRYINYGYFQPPPFVGGQLLVPALFLATSDDIELFDTPLEQKLFNELNNRVEHYSISLASYDTLPYGVPDIQDDHPLEDQPLFRVEGWKPEDRVKWNAGFSILYPYKLNIGYHNHPDGTLNYAKLYHDCYNFIFHQIITPIFWGNDISEWPRFEEISRNMAITLLSAHLEEYMNLYVSSVVHALGGVTGAILWTLLLMSSGYFSMRTKTPLTTLIFFITIIHIGNIAAVSILETPLIRYLFYTYFTFAVLTVILGERLLYLWKEKAENKCAV